MLELFSVEVRVLNQREYPILIRFAVGAVDQMMFHARSEEAGDERFLEEDFPVFTAFAFYFGPADVLSVELVVRLMGEILELELVNLGGYERFGFNDTIGESALQQESRV